MQFENGALRITNNICSLCNEEFGDFVQHMVKRKHINSKYLTREFCTKLQLNDELISSQTLPLSFSSLQTLIFYLKSQKLPLYFKQLYSCHKCFLVYDSITLLISHLNTCDSIRPENGSDHHFSETIIPHHSTNHHLATKLQNGIFKVEEESSSREAHIQEVLKAKSSHFDNVNNSSDSKVKVVEEVAIDSTTATKSTAASTSTADVLFQCVVSAGSDQLQIQEVDSSASRLPSPPSRQKNESDMVILRPTTRSVLLSKQCFNGVKDQKSLPKKQALESRSNKRLLRSLNKKPDLKSVIKAKAHKAKSKPENDTIVFNSVSKKKVSKICASLFKPLKCKFCNRGNFKNEANLQVHYQNVHNFTTVKQPSELLLARFTCNDSKEYFQFRCLVCLKMFENFTALSLHRCTFVQPKTINIPKKPLNRGGKGGADKANSATDPDTLPDYASENEFFKNLGLVRKANSTFRCAHLKPTQNSVSPRELYKRTAKTKLSPNSEVIVTLKPIVNGVVNGKNDHQRQLHPHNGFTEMQTRRSLLLNKQNLDGHQLRKRANLPENVIISLVDHKGPNTRRLVRLSAKLGGCDG